MLSLKQAYLFGLRSVVAACLCISTSHANRLVVTGLPEDIAQNVQLVAGEFPDDPRLAELYIDILPEQTKKALAAFGFYEPEINITRSKTGDELVVNLDIRAGSPVLISSINVKVNGEAANDVTFNQVRSRIPLKENAVFLSADYEATKGLLLDAAQAKGYFDFKFVTNKVLVSRIQRTAVVNLVADSGPRFTFGVIKFDQNVFSDEFLNRWVPFTSGEPYESKKIAELTQNLQNSGYFSSVRVSPQRDVRYGSTVPILVSLAQKDSNQVGLGLGFSSDEGVRGKITLGKPLINRAGHSADIELALSNVSQAITFSYRIPRDNQPLYNYWGIEYGFKNENDGSVKSLLSTLNFQRVRRFDSEWTESIFIRWERERSTFPEDSAASNFTTDLVLPGVRYTRNRSKGYPFLKWGQSSTLQLLYGNRELLSTIDFFKASVSFKYLRAVSQRNTFILSFQYGAITTNDFKRVPASQRYFAGGDRSIRGYAYRSVAPLDIATNEPVGGRYLEAGSVEYNYRFADLWSFAVFVDTGRAFNNFSTAQKIGAGVGIRWQSPVGPFRIDVAAPVGEENEKGEDHSSFQIHLSLGPDL